MGFKLVPLGKDSKTPTISSTNDIYNNPNYWTEEKPIEEYSRFSNIATTFGITYTSEGEANENKKCISTAWILIVIMFYLSFLTS